MNTQVNQVLLKAKKTLKHLTSFEKDPFAKARSFVNFPSSEERKALTRQRILLSLKKVGVATQSDLNALQLKINKLEKQFSPKAKKTKGK